jgi:hypothetical protein
MFHYLSNSLLWWSPSLCCSIKQQKKTLKFTKSVIFRLTRFVDKSRRQGNKNATTTRPLNRQQFLVWDVVARTLVRCHTMSYYVNNTKATQLLLAIVCRVGQRNLTVFGRADNYGVFVCVYVHQEHWLISTSFRNRARRSCKFHVQRLNLKCHFVVVGFNKFPRNWKRNTENVFVSTLHEQQQKLVCICTYIVYRLV